MTSTALTNAIIGQHFIRFPGSRLWRRNVGTFYGADEVNAMRRALAAGNLAAAKAILIRARPIICGIPGEPDCDGFIPLDTPRGVIGVRLACEVKGDGDKMRGSQEAFQKMMIDSGCIYLVARDVEQYFSELGEWKRRLEG